MDGRDSLRLYSSQSPGVMVDSNSYGVAAPNDSMVVPNSAGMMHGMRLSLNTMTSSVTKPLDSPVSLYHGDGLSGTRPSGVLNMGETVKKKRGRPRKYGPDGSMALALISRPSVSGYYNNPMLDPGTKHRGHPPGSGKKQQLDALGSSGIAFTPHVITVKAGEDVASKIMAFSQQGPRTVCILSANGAIHNVMLRQPATSGGTVTYEV